MDGKTIVEFNEITTVESGDKLLGVDISDTSASAGGTNKHFTKGNLLKEYVTLVGEETLTNKTLTSPVVNDPDITGGSVSATTNVVEVLKKAYPVGCIYTSTVSTNPNTLFGFGTWSEYGQGRVLVGKSADTEFDTIGKTGGEKTHTLTIAEMPIHTHTQNAHSHTVAGGGLVTDAGSYRAGSDFNINNTTTSSTTATNRNTGGGSAHNNLPPYIVVYFWKRES
mgnify:CR=1 FL=1